MPTTAIKERPILFSGPMVRAMLDGRKTQTRRLMTPQPHPEFLARGVVDVVSQWPLQDGVRWFMADGMSELVPCPHGAPGDRLWVRESIYIDDVRHDGPLGSERPADLSDDDLYYRADGECCQQIPECSCAEVGKPRWRPSMHMPRWASRITLEITGVRVELLQAIGDEDARAEGVEPQTTPGCGENDRWCHQTCKRHGQCMYIGTHTEAFRQLWDRNAWNPRFLWDANPWVWVIEFRMVTGS